MTPAEVAPIHAHAAEQRNPVRAEMVAATARLELRQMHVLRGIGLPAAQLYAAGLVGSVKAITDAGDLWEADEAGRAMLVTPAIEEGVVVDLIAFDPRKPDHWFLRTGNGWALGADAIVAARHAWPGEPALELRPTPLDYLRSGATGAAIVQWTPSARQEMLMLDEIHVDTARFAQQLRLELARPPRLPVIATTGRQRHAA